MMMRTMTCRQLGGACDMEFHASTFEAIEDQSKQHGRQMIKKGDKAHLKAMIDMQKRMQAPEVFNAWLEGKRKEFEGLPDSITNNEPE